MTGGRLSSSDSLDDARFPAGTVLADRYRIIGLLGKGGMGEVYRADDLTLGQPVALKFLPEAMAGDEARMSRFLSEVRIARQISHPNVCRVYDIEEVEGQRFISMEYVDGEDLASLLRRIGRFSPDKAAEIARQICAGLAAAHDKGVLHRDLKPANVMIDGRGKVRITDFGLASLAGDVEGREIQIGTPAYMAPEQLVGKEVTLRSDIYALGLVLYELFTGKPAYKAESRDELRRTVTQTTVTSPSSHVGDLDQAVERVILRCLDKDPRARPANALAVAVALPGGDPLAAALAAGETPSPEMVAAAGEEGALKPIVAWLLLAAVFGGLVLAHFQGLQNELLVLAPLERTPDALADRARELLRDLGHDVPILDSARGFETDDDLLQHIEDNDQSLDRWEKLRSGRPPAIRFWYRQSPRHLLPDLSTWQVSRQEPPMDVSGMMTVVLDPQGRLLSLDVVPPQFDDTDPVVEEPDWPRLFVEAGLEPASFGRVRPEWNPPVSVDARAAWEGEFEEMPGETIRVEAAGYRGKPVYFRILGPWSRPERMAPAPQTTGQRAAELGGLVIIIAAFAGAGGLARRNLRLGRGDRAGAFKIASWFVVGHVIAYALVGDHVPVLAQIFYSLIRTTGTTLFLAGMVWVLYLALEPFMRRRWPDTLISWNRLVAGRFRDPRVGRDILVGLMAAVLFPAVGSLWNWLVITQGGLPPAQPQGVAFEILLGSRKLAGWSLDQAIHSIIQVMVLIFVLAILRAILRRGWVASAAFVAIFSAVGSLGSPYPLLVLPLLAILLSMAAFVLTRFGLVAAIAAMFALSVFGQTPLTAELGSWVARAAIQLSLAFSALALFAFYSSLGGRPLFGGALLEE
jgi:serine/threonine-protein kinase